ncbi:SagB/ThcOx family dehydrogenase [Pseudomonas sp. W4I3]|uniref:SagB/ThcOx family dehydrogenase n=1 Tax=Pseudomonas sp. W4I3 TaxID=3042294 RepID=UPI002787E615|nr:SagB/ThcOx family dehydrogenase [Pseudomonas sp. W4I3]MDQ0741025.1 SagB-type dehydrogenase family enzyme [Pseudomonas sp. W4I3]
MKNIPHDYYLRFVDAAVYAAVIDFHCKGNFTFHKAFRQCTGLHSLSESQLAQLSGNELALYPDMGLTIDMKISERDREKWLYRNESCEKFSPALLKFEEVEKLVSPLVSRTAETHKRGYPSGGALYPVELFICKLTDDIGEWPAAGHVLHLLPNSRKFEVMQDKSTIENIKSAVLTSEAIGSPSLAIVYVVYLPKNLFKYRYRGYRMALMEVGSIYMLVEVQAKQLGLACRPWSAYTDTMLCKGLGLNPALFLPMCVHLIGKGEQHENV